MGKSISVREAIPKVFAALIGIGVYLGLQSIGPPAVAVMVGIFSAYMVYEDWKDQTIDIMLLSFVWLAFLTGNQERLWFLYKFAFIWLLFRCLYLWMMRFIPKSEAGVYATHILIEEEAPSNNTESDEVVREEILVSENRIPIGYLPAFYLSFVIVSLVCESLPFIVPDFLYDAYSGFLVFSDEIAKHPEYLGSALLLLFIICCAGEKRRKKHAEDFEVWPFGDGDVWFIATWGAALPVSLFFMVCFFSQIFHLALYMIIPFSGGEATDE